MAATEQKSRVLVVDDESRIRDLLRIVLESRGYEVAEAENGLQAVKSVMADEPDIVILDVMMPVMDGLTACRKIRSVSQCPILMLTAKGEDYDQVDGLQTGADDYVVKPFTPMVLEARVQALLRRSGKKDNAQNRYGRIAIDRDAREVSIDDTPIPTNRKEFDLLFYMADNANISLSRDQILEHVWGYDYLGTPSTVDAHVGRLRNKLGSCAGYIVTLRGYGYKFEVSE